MSVKVTGRLIGAAASLCRNRCGRMLGEDDRQEVALCVVKRSSNASDSVKLCCWRAAGDWLLAERKKTEAREAEADLLQCHDQWLRADRALVESLEEGERYGVAGRYGAAPDAATVKLIRDHVYAAPLGATVLPSLPYESESTCRWQNLQASKSAVECAAGVLPVDVAKEFANDLGDWFASREVNAEEVVA